MTRRLIALALCLLMLGSLHLQAQSKSKEKTKSTPKKTATCPNTKKSKTTDKKAPATKEVTTTVLTQVSVFIPYPPEDYVWEGDQLLLQHPHKLKFDLPSNIHGKNFTELELTFSPPDKLQLMETEFASADRFNPSPRQLAQRTLSIPVSDTPALYDLLSKHAHWLKTSDENKLPSGQTKHLGDTDSLQLTYTVGNYPSLTVGKGKQTMQLSRTQAQDLLKVLHFLPFQLKSTPTPPEAPTEEPTPTPTTEAQEQPTRTIDELLQ